MDNQSIDSQSVEKERSVADMCVGEQACFKSCCEECLALLLLERGIVPGSTVSLCWCAPWSDALCIEVRGTCFSLRRSEAKTMLLQK